MAFFYLNEFYYVYSYTTIITTKFYSISISNLQCIPPPTNLSQWTLEYMCLFESWFSLDRCPGVGLLDEMIILFLVFWGISILSYTMVALIYILTNSLIGFPFSTPSPAFTLCRLFDDGHFMVALFSIAKTWKQPKYPSTEEQIKKMWYIHTMEYYSAIKRNDKMAFAATWMDPGNYHTRWSESDSATHLYVEILKRTQRTYLHNWNRLTDFEKFMVTKGDRWRWGGMGWGFGIEMF